MSVLNQSGDDAVECPLCMEPLEVDDLNFFPCTCGYQICRFCWHRIRTDENGLCPACRKAYSENPADFKPLTKEEISRLKAEKRLKDQQRKQRVTENRKHLANVRVVQKNLVFVVGLPMRLADADVLKRHEYFGKFGKIHKVVINQSTSYAGSQGPSASAYVTYQRQEDALRAIEAVNNITVDGRTVKTSLGTTKYCSHFMRNQACPKPDCMYLHDLGDQEASFTKEEMHQGKHQEYERKLVQSLNANSSTGLNRKPTISPPVGNGLIRENGTAVPQIKEAWPSLQLCPVNNVTNNKDTSSSITVSVQQQQQQQQQQVQQQQQQSNDTTNNVIVSQTENNNRSQQQNNNNKGESVTASASSNSRRGKVNNESKVQAARNKHKNNQNKEKHSSTRTNSRPESTSRAHSTQLNDRQQQINEQNHINGSNNKNNDIVNSSESKNNEQQITTTTSTTTTPNGRCKNEYQQNNNNRQKSRQISTKIIEQSLHEINISNNILRNGSDQSQSENESEPQREGSTPVSTTSSSPSEDLTVNAAERLVADTLKENIDPDILNLLPTNNDANVNSSADDQLNSSQLYNNNTNNTQTNHINHRSIFQADNNSFFSSNTFQKISNIITLPSNVQNNTSNNDWTTTCLTSIPDSFPTVHSSEDWQAAFGFHPEINQSSHQTPLSSSPCPSLPFNADNLLDDDIYLNSDLNNVTSPKVRKNYDTNAIIANTANASSPASKFMAEFQHHSRQQQRFILQNQENCDYIKQNGHTTENLLIKQDYNTEIKPEDDLGFDPFHETQKALAELMENELQLQQQRLFQQQQHQPQQRNREDHSRSQQQQYFSSSNLNSQHFTQQVAHLAHLQQQAHQLQNLQVLQHSQSLMSRLPQSILQQTNLHNSMQSTMSVIGNSIGQRSRLPPPGFPSSTPNHMNSFGLGIPRAAPSNNTMAGTQPPQQTTYLSNGINKCATDPVYSLKDWCEITGQQLPQQQSIQSFHHQSLHQKSGWNNFGPNADWTSIDPAIVSSSRPLQFQATSTWQFSRYHPSSLLNGTHNAQQEQNSSAEHWTMQPPPGFGGPAPGVQMNGPQSNTASQSHTKLISAGSEIENC